MKPRGCRPGSGRWRWPGLLLALLSCPANADPAGEAGQMDFMLHGLAMTWRNPDDRILYDERNGNGAGLIARVIAGQRPTAATRIKFNLYQTWLPTSLTGSAASTGARLDAERSSNLEHSWSDDDYIHTAVDQMSATWSDDNLSLTAGRQPINLATTFYFTPNDLFAPYAAQAFYRVYKPGVDALRAEYRLSDLSLLGAYSVLGYRPATASANGWSRTPEAARASHLLRYSAVFGDFDLAVLAGKVRERRLLGVGLQGEWLDWLGLRAEAQLTRPRHADQHPGAEYTLGLEHHFASSLDLRLEYFRHGAGHGDVDDYAATAITPGMPAYLGRHYAAAGGSYELMPLLTGQLLLMRNLDDSSLLGALSGQYSLSDEGELSLALSLPWGKTPRQGVLRSEYGAAPRLLSLELRQYF